MKRIQNNAYYMRMKDLESKYKIKINNSTKKFYFHNLSLKGCFNK